MTAGDKIVFMGTPQYAAAHLGALIEAGRRVAGVVSQPDRPHGRGLKLEPTPVKQLAIEHGIPIIQPASLRKEPQALDWIRNLHPDLLVVVAYGIILPESLLQIPPDGGWNVHASLLPKYRGAAPIQWAIVRGEKRTGITLMKMDAGMDTGDILLQEEIDVGPEETEGELAERLIKVGRKLLIEGLRLRDEGRIQRTKQDNSGASIAPLINKEDRPVSWNDTAENIHNKIRGFNPRPGARSGELKLLRSKLTEGAPAKTNEPGTVIEVLSDGILVATGDGSLLLTEVQPPGGRAMTAADYAHGHHIQSGQRI